MIKPLKHLKKVNTYQSNNLERSKKIKLDLNENCFGCSPKVIEALKNISAENISFYPEYKKLTNTIALKYGISNENILITNGGDDAIRCVVQTYIKPLDKVLIPDPSFSMFELQLALQQAKIIKIMYEQDFSFPFKKFYKLLNKNIKMAIIINPASPAGTSINDSEIINILEKAKQNNIAVLIDETYHHFNKKTYIKLIEKYNNLIILQSFSKAHGLAGIRLGFLASNKHNIEQISKVSLPYSVNSLAVIAGIAALEDDEFTKTVVENINTEKQYLQNELKKLGFNALDSCTNFLLVNCKEKCKKIYNELNKQNILVKYFPNHKLLRDYIRISVGKHQENEELIKALQRIIKTH